MYEALSDEALMLEFQRGDAAAFDVLLGRHRRPLFSFLWRQVGNATVAEDLFQDVCERIFKQAPRYKVAAKFTTWMYTIARNRTVDYYRRQKFRRTDSLSRPVAGGEDGQAPVLGDTLPSPNPGPDTLTDRAATRAAIEECVAQLEPVQREVFLLREVQGLPFDEIARITDANLSTVKSRMRYALQHLRRLLTAAQVLPEATAS